MAVLPEETFVSPEGVFPASVITPAMVRALDSADDKGCLTGSAQTLNKLIRYGLAVDCRLLGVRITHAGWNAVLLFPLPAEQESHRTRTFEQGSLERHWHVKPSGRAMGWRPDRHAAWATCTCGWKEYADDRTDARRRARVHRKQTTD